MSQITEKRTKTHTYEYNHVLKTICDWCEKEVLEPGGHDTREFELEFSEGTSYPEGGSRSGWQVEDLCDNCIYKLRVLLEKKGVTTSALEVDW